MASAEAQKLKDLYQSWNERRAANQNEPIAFLRSLFQEWEQVSTEVPGVWYESIDGPVTGIRAVPIGADEARAILYVHGGGYIGGSSASHRKFAGHLAHAIGAPAFAVDYRLAPEHKYPAQLDDVRAAFDWLVAGGVSPSQIIVAGDSAGGALATALALLLRDEGAPVPGAVVALSPYYDSEGFGDSFESNTSSDIMAGARGRAGIHANVSMFIADESQRTSPYVTALRADVTGLPPHFLTVGEGELLVDGVLRFGDMLREAGIDVVVEVVPDMQHVFPLMAGRAPEADASVRAIAEFVRTHVPTTRNEAVHAPA
ncbi:alpha/beta hydrolase [Agromyces sp. Marseille-P2726]|uniref:alpha/beta hydrolase n=1 Tax=Agromyces sp. Marseille-P2726 TaxID=2709132 RepID=UPI00156F4393|nr:alpha/beta hydrolase [Agromyces sp. Marseille-P2726]